MPERPVYKRNIHSSPAQLPLMSDYSSYITAHPYKEQAVDEQFRAVLSNINMFYFGQKDARVCSWDQAALNTDSKVSCSHL